MAAPQQTRRALNLVADAATSTALQLLSSTSGPPEQRRFDLLGGVPEVIGYYQEGTAALAADYYDAERDTANVSGSYTARLVIVDRAEKIRNATVWAAQPLFDGDDVTAGSRLAEVVQLEAARPFRDTITGNSADDAKAIGWKRISAGGCKMCAMLAARGAVYKESTARFATHPHCHCSAAPVFLGSEEGPEADVLQYVASKRSRSPKQRAQLREYLNENFAHIHG
ncbi:hypothetical protein NYQ35_16055 [Curtobacterium flaccumfaciens pv. flaccumfaciens]|uniref:VG15 protein n=1 Tax=Curtobacterium flaccumfaciens TaxID=2035 RepID=UPI00217D6FD8|nr:hypothetical protein [Curtobacterium flaccumfaciens]MCS6570320.1 hypothetical protein [Curtobacterium flaccumfaciens pv. flaccumfaciens]MCS6585176.1 hypothetical protein [Curtobacterium flaccumfaciens pv. flaccumfaciens]